MKKAFLFLVIAVLFAACISAPRTPLNGPGIVTTVTVDTTVKVRVPIQAKIHLYLGGYSKWKKIIGWEDSIQLVSFHRKSLISDDSLRTYGYRYEPGAGKYVAPAMAWFLSEDGLLLSQWLLGLFALVLLFLLLRNILRIRGRHSDHHHYHHEDERCHREAHHVHHNCGHQCQNQCRFSTMTTFQLTEMIRSAMPASSGELIFKTPDDIIKVINAFKPGGGDFCFQQRDININFTVNPGEGEEDTQTPPAAAPESSTGQA